MTARLVPPITPGRRPGGHLGSHPVRHAACPLPIPLMPVRSTPETVYGLAVIDCHGRTADRIVLHALGWRPGRPVALSIIGGSVLAVPDDRADVAISVDGYLRLPIGLRRRCGLTTGDRVLLVADPPADRLLIHPPAALDAVLGAHHTALLPGATS